MEQNEFLSLAEEYKDMVYRIALNYLGSTQDAEDTVQEVLLRLLRWDKSFDSREHARNWLIRVTINQCKNSLRMARLRRHAPLEEADLPVQFQLPEQSELYLTVMSMPEKYRTVLYLFYYEELPVREIARVLGVNSSAVTTRLSRARDQLRSKLTEVRQDA